MEQNKKDKIINIVAFFLVIFFVIGIIGGLIYTGNHQAEVKDCCDYFCENSGDFYCGYSSGSEFVCKQNGQTRFVNSTYNFTIEYRYVFNDLKGECKNALSVS